MSVSQSPPTTQDPPGALTVPETKIGRLRDALLALYHEHVAEGTIPTNRQFLWYELINLGVVDKTQARGKPGVRRGIDQDVTEALTQLRDRGLIPWGAIVDETRALHDHSGGPTLRALVEAVVRGGRLDPWAPALPPLILCESRSLAGVLGGLALEYRCLVTATNGQCAGHLRNEVAPLMETAAGEAPRRVLYLGDWDWQGRQIEANTRRVLEEYVPAGFGGRWERVALTDVQVRDHGLPVIEKLDRRYKPARTHPAVETEALKQHIIIGLLRTRLDELLPGTLGDVQVRERDEREALLVLLAEGEG